MGTTRLITSIILLMGSMAGGYWLSNSSNGGVQLDSKEWVSNLELYEDLKLTQQPYDSDLKGMNDYINNHVGHRKWVNDTEGRAVIQNIKDYSVKITSRCSAGTGWFLDYEIPEGGRYPTKWFVATNAHVISNYKFKDNPYKQVLPIGSSWDEKKRACLKDGETSTQITLFKDTSEYWEDMNSYLDSPEIWSRSDLRKHLYPAGNVYAKNASDEHWEYLNGIKLVYARLKDPKLFYAPINFLGDKYEKSNVLWWTKNNYYKDFAVLEVNFESEDIAKRMTNNFYEKKKNQGLNFFKNELLEDKTGNELVTDSESYFVAGYPGNSYNHYKAFGNYSSQQNTASHLIPWSNFSTGDDEFYVKNKHNQRIPGHADVGKMDKKLKYTTITWNGETHYNWGYNYVLDNMRLGPGASGSLVTNKDGDVLGLYRMHNEARHYGFVEPLRSKGHYKNSQIIIPRYDLIKGAIGQVNSYKQQLDTYYPNMKTHLRNTWSKN